MLQPVAGEHSTCLVDFADRIASANPSAAIGNKAVPRKERGKCSGIAQSPVLLVIAKHAFQIRRESDSWQWFRTPLRAQRVRGAKRPQARGIRTSNATSLSTSGWIATAVASAVRGR